MVTGNSAMNVQVANLLVLCMSAGVHGAAALIYMYMHGAGGLFGLYTNYVRQCGLNICMTAVVVKLSHFPATYFIHDGTLN